MSPSDLSDRALFADALVSTFDGPSLRDADMVTADSLGVYDPLYDDAVDSRSDVLGDPRAPRNSLQSEFPRPQRLHALILDALRDMGPSSATAGTPLLLFGRRGDVISRLCQSAELDRLCCDPRRLVSLGLLATVADAAEVLRPRHPA